MLFTIQAYIEDYLRRRSLTDPDGYAVKVANLYFNQRSTTSLADFLAALHRVRTLLFLNSGIDDRPAFESQFLSRLDAQFKKKVSAPNPGFPGGTSPEGSRLQKLPRLTVPALLREFTAAVEARAVDSFWISRKTGSLQHRPEKIAQALFAVFARGALHGKGIVLREISSGIGFVDVGVLFSATLHLLEFRVLRAGFSGPAQLSYYMKMEQRRRADLLVIDARPPSTKNPLPATVDVACGEVSVWQIDVNPSPPSGLR